MSSACGSVSACASGKQQSRTEESGRKAIIAVELHIVESSRDAVPSRHSCRLDTLYTRGADDNHAAVSHGAANKHDFQLDECTHRNLFRAQKKDACGADISRDKRHGKIFSDGTHAA